MNITAFPMCCGAKVIQSFSGDSEDQRNRFVELVQKFDKDPNDGFGAGHSTNRMLCVILNDGQCQPKTLQTLADLGFVHVARQNNGVHNSWVNLFVRCRMDKDKSSYKAPEFTYPGMSTADWGEAQHFIPDLKKKMTPKPVVPNPFIKPSDRALEYGFVKADAA